MIRNSSSFFLSFTIHAIIAMLALTAYQQVVKKMPTVKENRVCITLSHCIVPPKPKPIPKKVIPTPPPVKKITQPKPVKPKPELKSVTKPKPIVKKYIPVADPEVVKVVPEPVSEEIVIPVITEETVVDAPVVPPQPSISPEESYLQEHLLIIAKLLQENLYYPRIARKRGITGEVIVEFELMRNGEATRIKVNSGDRAILNKAAITTIERLSGDFPKPDEPITLHVPIRYQLQ